MLIKIIIAAHKPVQVPNDQTYFPVYVGSKFHESTPKGFLRDDSGKNISWKNPHYNELTAIYWAKYNLDFDILGLVHYRRFFVNKKKFGSRSYDLIKQSDIKKLMAHTDVVVPKKRHYYIETIESHFYHSHDRQGLDCLKKVMEEQPEAYRFAFRKVLNARSAHMFNMFIMKKKVFQDYTNWLFSILDQVDELSDFNSLEGNETRVDGFLAEFLLDVWLKANEVPYTECDYKFTENQHWIRKIYGFLFNKFNRRKFVTTHISNNRK